MFAGEPRQATYRAPGKHRVTIEQGGRSQAFLLEFARLRGIVEIVENSRGRRLTMEFDDSEATGGPLDGQLTVALGALDRTRITTHHTDHGDLYTHDVRKTFDAQSQHLPL